MASNKLNFFLNLGLKSGEFKAGLKSVEASLNRFKMKMKAMAGGLAGVLGFGSVFKEMASNAKRMDQASTTLKNVSNGYEELISNQKFAMDLASKYNQELIGITENFAKFHSSADQANMGLKDQYKIFESLTRASTYFNLSADETNGVFLAITQMMSKGKVATEELRRQLGERLPGAFGIFANSLNMSTAELDEALRKGQVMAKDALPKFAQALNQITQALDVNTIQGKTNKLKNVFTSLVSSLNIKSTYKKLLGEITQALEWLEKHLLGFKRTVVSIFVGITSHNLKDGFSKLWRSARMAQDKEIAKMLSDLDKAKIKFEKKVNDLQSQSKYFTIETRPEKIYGTDEEMIGAYLRRNNEPGDPIKVEAERLKLIKITDKEENNIYELHKAKLEKQKEYNKAASTAHKILKNIGATLKGVLKNFAAGVILAGISRIVQKLIQTNKELKKFLNYSKLINKEFEENRIDLGNEGNLIREAKKKVELDEDKKVKKDGTLNFKNKYSEEERENAIKALNNLLGLEGKEALTSEQTVDNYEKINKLATERLDIIQKGVDLQLKEKLLADAIVYRAQKQNEFDDLIKDIELLEKRAEHIKNNPRNYVDPAREQSLVQSQLKPLLRKRNKYEQGLSDIDKKINEYASDIQSIRDSLGIVQKKAEEEELLGKVEDKYGEIQKTYYKNLSILNDKLGKGILTQDEYDKALENLTNSTLDGIYGLDKTYFATSKFAQTILQDALRFKNNNELKNIEKEYEKSLINLKNEKDAGLLAEEDYQKSMDDLTRETLKAIVALGDLSLLSEGFGKKIKDLFDKLVEANNKKAQEETTKQNQKELAEIQAKKPDLTDRSHLFDYGKEKSELLYEDAQHWQKKKDEFISYRDELVKFYEDKGIPGALDEVDKELDKLIAKADTLQKAANLEKIKEDVANLRLELAKGITSSMSGTLSLIKNIRRNIEDIFNPDTDGFEKVEAILETILGLMDGIIGAIETVQNITKIISTLTAANESKKKAELILDEAQNAQASKELVTETALASVEGAKAATKAEEVATTGAQMAAETALAGVETTNAATKLAATSTQIAANEAEAISAGAASTSLLPFPANIAAIGAVIAALGAIFASLPKFSQGGLVKGGSSTGDKLLARVNSGEMILNKKQQASLLNQLEGNNGKKVEVQLKVKGSDLVGVLNNYSKKISK